MSDGAKLFGNPVWVIEVPQRPSDLARRWHNKYAKDALTEAIVKYHGHKQGFPEHFKRDARQKFNHKPRDPKYQRIKARKYRSTIDLVKTERTKRRMLSQYKLLRGGSATGGNLSATIVLTFPFKGGAGRFRTDIKRSAMRQAQAMQNAMWIIQMATELQRFDEDDPVLLAEWFGDAYWKLVNAHRSNRKRIRIVTR